MGMAVAGLVLGGANLLLLVIGIVLVILGVGAAMISQNM